MTRTHRIAAIPGDGIGKEVLPEGLRVPLSLSALEGLSLQEIGEVMGLTAGAVKVRIHRGRKRLTELLGPDFGVNQ